MKLLEDCDTICIVLRWSYMRQYSSEGWVLCNESASVLILPLPLTGWTTLINFLRPFHTSVFVSIKMVIYNKHQFHRATVKIKWGNTHTVLKRARHKVSTQYILTIWVLLIALKWWWWWCDNDDDNNDSVTEVIRQWHTGIQYLQRMKQRSSIKYIYIKNFKLQF